MWDRHLWDVTVPSPDQCQQGGEGAEISLSLHPLSLRPPRAAGPGYRAALVAEESPPRFATAAFPFEAA